MADGELVVALLVGNDQLNEVKLKNHLGADFFDVASEEESGKMLFKQDLVHLASCFAKRILKIIARS